MHLEHLSVIIISDVTLFYSLEFRSASLMKVLDTVIELIE